MTAHPLSIAHPLSRRRLLGLAAGATLSSCRAGDAGNDRHASLRSALASLEGGGRLGVALLDLGKGTVEGHRLDERFALCSTFKLVLAAAVLERASQGARPLDATVHVGESELLSHAPITRPLVLASRARGNPSAAISLETLAHAAQAHSDGTAANVLLRDIGGPTAFRAFCRAHGDETTRLDRYEPEMNDVLPGDERDTTTPRAMARLVADLLGPGLPAHGRAMLRAWMIETETGAARVRAGLPPGWIAGDKTGTGGSEARSVTAKANDVVWIEPPGRAPLVVAAYYDTNTIAEWPTEAQEAVLAAVGRTVARFA